MPVTRSSWARPRWQCCTRRWATPSPSATVLPATPRSTSLRPLSGVVGTATLPAIGTSGALHTSMGTGAMISEGIESAAFKKAITQSDPNLNGQDVEVVRLRRGVTAAAGLASLHKITAAADKVMAADPQGQGDVYEVLGVQRPAEIVNYQATGATPGILASGLAVGAVRGPRPHLGHVGPSPASGLRPPQDARIHSLSTCGDGRLAGLGRRRGRHRHRSAPRDRARADGSGTCSHVASTPCPRRQCRLSKWWWLPWRHSSWRTWSPPSPEAWRRGLVPLSCSGPNEWLFGLHGRQRLDRCGRGRFIWPRFGQSPRDRSPAAHPGPVEARRARTARGPPPPSVVTDG